MQITLKTYSLPSHCVAMVEETANLDRLVSVYNQSDVHTLEMFIPYKFQLLPFCKSNVYYILLRNR